MKVKVQMSNIKKEIKYNLGKPFFASEENIIKYMQKAEVISFDIFDTLVKRNCSSSTEVHAIVGNEFCKQTGIRIQDYKELRVNAEKRARELSKQEEVTLSEIFSNLNWGTDSQKEKLKQLEVDTEILVCCVNQRFEKIYKKAQELNKKIIITSDMYLPEEIIKKILEKCGYYGYEKLFLSSTYKYSKSRGGLYRKIKEIYKEKKILHIGDDFKADYVMCQKAGIKTVLIDGRRNNLRYWTTKNLRKGEDLYYYLNNYISSKVDEFERIGCEVLAPMLLGFSKWLHEQLEKEHIDKVFFLSREGKILQKAYEILYPDDKKEKRYLYVSRQALIVPLIADAKNYTELIDIVKSFLHSSKLRTMRIICGIGQKEFEDALGEIGYNEQTLIYDVSEEKQECVFDIIKRLGQAYFEEQKRNAEEYLSVSGFHGKLAIVDIGWVGTMQRALQSLCGEKVSIHGYYIGLRNLEADSFYENMHRKGYLFTIRKNHNYDLMARFTNDIFEMLFLNDMGSVQKYEKNTKVVPVLLDSEYREKEAEIIKRMQNAALEFLRNIECQQSTEDRTEVSADTIMNVYKKFAVYPELNTLQLFEDFCFLDGVSRKMLPEKSLLYYLCNIRQLKQDINGHCSKVWFLKWLLKVNLPYFDMLKLLVSIGMKSNYRKKYYS